MHTFYSREYKCDTTGKSLGFVSAETDFASYIQVRMFTANGKYAGSFRYNPEAHKPLSEFMDDCAASYLYE